MGSSFEFFKNISKQRIPSDQLQFYCTKLQINILMYHPYYLSSFSFSDVEPDVAETYFDGATSLTERGNLIFVSNIRVSAAQKFKEDLFMVPRLEKNQISKYQPVEVLISFLVRLLYHKTGLIIDSCKDQIDNLEKELRFLITILRDTSLMLCIDEHEEFRNLLPEFEAVANEAGSFVHSLFFITDRAEGEMDERIAVIFNGIDLLKANIMKFFDLVPFMSRSTYMTPKTSVLDSVLVVDSLIRDVEDLMNRDDSLVADVKDQIKTLRQGLICLQSFIKDEGSPQPSELKECCMRIGDFAHEAEFLIVSFLAGDAPQWYLVSRLIDVNHKIELSGIELREITMKFGGLKVAKSFNKLLSSLSKSNTEVGDEIIGFEDKMMYILNQLVGGGAELRVISIFGMPGLGKTTLAKKLYNHPSVKYRFDKLSWSVVSQTYVRRNLLISILKNIASELDKGSTAKMEEERLVEIIHKTLKGRRYLLVFDDIWESNIWDELLRCFPNDGNGSRILFTTRNREVAPPNCIMYAMPFLSNDQCWELLEKKVFDNQPSPEELLEIGKEVAAYCRGVPLAAAVIAGILSTVDREERTWIEVSRRLSSYVVDGGEDSVMQILELSYNHLPQHLKPCFLFLGVFHKDPEITVRDMMKLWIAEGFIHKENENNVESVAEDYLMELMDKSLVMVGKRRSDGGVKTCMIHDLLRDLCVKICEEENLMRFVNSKYWKEDDDHLKLVQSSSDWNFCWRISEHFGKGTTMDQPYVPDMRLMRILIFRCSSIYLTGIEYLISLKYLIIGDLPPSIGNLVNLEYLLVESDKRVSLSSTVKMKKLRHIEVPYGSRYDNDCNAFKTNKLEYLSFVVIRNAKDEEMLKCSPHLRKLKCKYSKRVFGNINLSFLSRLESLRLSCTKSLFRQEISFPSSIKKLSLVGFVKLGRKTMSMIGRLENLEVLKLQLVDFEGNRWDTRDDEFQKLRYLKLVAENLAHWNVGSSEHFPKLEQLELNCCYQLREVPWEIVELPAIKTIKVDALMCRKSFAESVKRIQQQQWDLGNEELTVILTDEANYFTSFDRFCMACLDLYCCDCIL